MRLSAYLKLAGIAVSSPTIQRHRIKPGMAATFARLLKLQDQRAAEPVERSCEQIQPIAKATPCFRERHVESSRPGERLAQDTVYLGKVKGVGKVDLHRGVDTYALGCLWRASHPSQVPEATVSALPNDARPCAQQRGIPISTVLTDTRREFGGTPTPPSRARSP
jgi:hypothetical protein